MAKNLSITIPTAEQDDIVVTRHEDKTYINFYHEVLVLTTDEATSLMAALRASVLSIGEDS